MKQQVPVQVAIANPKSLFLVSKQIEGFTKYQYNYPG